MTEQLANSSPICSTHAGLTILTILAIAASFFSLVVLAADRGGGLLCLWTRFRVSEGALLIRRRARSADVLSSKRFSCQSKERKVKDGGTAGEGKNVLETGNGTISVN